METNNYNQLEKSFKDFWSRPEGTVGMIAGIILAAGFAYLLLPYLITFLGNIYIAGAMLLGLYSIMWILKEGTFLSRVRLGYKIFMRKITGWLIEIDPIGILRENIKKMQGNRVQVREQIGVLYGQKSKLTTKLAKNDTHINQEMKMIKQAKDQEKKSQFILSSRQVGRLKTQSITFGGMLTKITELIKRLEKIDEFLDFLIQDTAFEVETMEENLKMVTAGSNAIKSAMKVIMGNADDNDLTEATMRFVVDDIASKQGMIDNYLVTTKSFIDKMDLQNGVYEAEGLDLLDSFEKEMDDFLTKGAEQQKIKELPEHTATFTLPLPEVQDRDRVSNYNNIFNDKQKGQ